MRWTVWAAAAVVAVGSLAAAQDAAEDPAKHTGPEDVSALLAKLCEQFDVPAVGGAIVGLDGVVAIGVDGLRAVGSEETVTTTDRWHLGSCTKSMTATLIARLEMRKKPPLTFDTTIEKAFPEYARKALEPWRTVTMRQLLGHRGGAPGDLERDGLWGTLWVSRDSPRKQRARLTKTVLSWEPEPVAGTGFSYSNAGYAIVGHAAELRTKVDWESLIRDELFDPLGMDSAGFGAPGAGKKKPGAGKRKKKSKTIVEPQGHRRIGEKWFAVGTERPLSDNPAAIGPGATVHASLADWGKFIAAHLRGARGDVEGFLPKTSFERLHTSLDGQSYAQGWDVTERGWARGEGGKGLVLKHNGSNTMWYCVSWLAPERGRAYIAVCNAGGDPGTKACDAVVSALMRRDQE